MIASQTIPIIVIAPMLLVWVGYGLAPKVIVVALISFFPIVVNMVDGLKSVDRDMVNLMRTLGAHRLQVFFKVQAPTSLPYLFSGMRVAIAVSVIGAVIGEWVGSSEGLGYLMIRSKPQFLTERVFAAIAILSAMGVGLFIAQQKGYFEDEGLDVTMYTPSDTSTVLQTVASGSDDFGMNYQPDVILARNEGVPVVSIAAVVQHPLNSVMALESSGISRPSQLAGKKIGYPGIPTNEPLLDTMLKADGVAAGALGASDWRILTSHILPATMPYVAVAGTLGLASAILIEAALNFLGIGVQIPTPTWGNMMTAAQSIHVIQNEPWLWIPPGLTIALTVLAVNFVGDGIRDALDPRIQIE